MLTELCHCITVYKSNGAGTKAFDDGTYRASENNNNEAFYQFGYKVNAIETGDIKQHIETRRNNDVRGEYFLEEPNGVSRHVQYVADSDGFKAVVRHRFGVEYSKNSNPNSFTRSDSNQQGLHTHVLNHNRIDSVKRLPQEQIASFDRFLEEQQNKYMSPKSITNQNSLPTLVDNSGGGQSTNKSNSTETPSVQVVGRRRQYEVIDPEVDIDIRRSIQKPFLNLAKLKRPRTE